MRTPSGQFLRHLRTRLPWVVAIAAVVAAASTGTFWATKRIRSLDTDLSTAGRKSNELRRQLQDLKADNDDLRTRLADAESSLGRASTSMGELRKRVRDLHDCVSRSNPDGGPIVTLIPNHGPVGTRVEMAGYCFRGPQWQRKYPASPYGVSLIRELDIDGFDCEIIAGGQKHIEVTKDGRMRGYFVVADDGNCFQSSKTADVTPGLYSLTIGCHACFVADFRVTSEESERNRLPACRSGDFGWSLQGPDGPSAMQIIGVKVYPTHNTSCRLTLTASVSIVDAAGTSLSIAGNSARAEFDAAVGRQRIGAAWAWTNWCGTGSYRVQVTLGSEARSTALQTGGPRCEFKKFASRLRPLVPWMEGVSSFTS